MHADGLYRVAPVHARVLTFRLAKAQVGPDLYHSVNRHDSLLDFVIP